MARHEYQDLTGKVWTQASHEVSSSLSYTIRQLTEDNARLLAKAIDYETKRDVVVSTFEIVMEGRLSAQKALFAQCEETKKLTAENARLRAALEKIAGIRGRDLSEPWSDAELAEITLKGQPMVAARSEAELIREMNTK